MCGIVGVATRNSRPAPDLVVRMRETMRHRGPDGAGLWSSPCGHVVLGHRRLAILDLSEAGAQPMAHADSATCVTFNGEIYNHDELRRQLERRGHRFRSRADTEVLLAAYREWGSACLDRLNGMFAFAIYDGRRRSLFLARDRAGEKPLFYAHVPGRGFRFASELKALLADPAQPREMDPEALNYYLAFGYVPGGLCMIRGCRKLPAGHSLTLSLDDFAVEIRRYWTLPAARAAPARDEHELEADLERLLSDAVRRQLQADVPVAVLLSGGIDSSLIAALAARESSRPIRTFTVCFPGQGRYDEAEHARAVAHHFGTEHTELEAPSFGLEDLEDLAWQYDEPIADSSMLPTYLLARAVRPFATVALGGDGGDELFGGYRHYSWLQRLERWHGCMPLWLRRAIAGGAEHWLPVGTRGRTYMAGIGGPVERLLSHVDLHFDRVSREGLVAPDLWERMRRRSQPENLKPMLSGTDGGLAGRAMAVDFATYLPDDILTKVDRASMLASLEVRAPWLDRRVVEFAFGAVPDSLRATPTHRKILPKRLAQRLLPKTLDLQRKQGFSIPVDRWLRDDMGGNRVRHVLSDVDGTIFRQPSIDRLLQTHDRGFRNGNRIFALIMLELWRRHYRMTLPSLESIGVSDETRRHHAGAQRGGIRRRRPDVSLEPDATA